MKSPNPASILELVGDAYRFSQTFAKSIEEHPLLVYFGALPFAPITSTVYQKFHDNTLFPSISGGFQQKWPLVKLADNYPASSMAFSLNNCDTVWHTLSDIEAFSAQRGHHDRVQSVAFSSDGSYIISHSYDKSVLEWDVISGLKLSGHVAEHEPDTSHHVSPCTIEIGRTGWVIHVPTNRFISKLPAMVTSLCSASNEKSIAVGTQDGRVIIMNFPQDVLTSSMTRIINGKVRLSQVD